MKILAAIAVLSWLWAILAIAGDHDRQSGALPAITVFLSNVALAIAVLIG